jgi:hypothetical protein
VNSALSAYFFGPNRDQKLTIEKFVEFQHQLQREILTLEVSLCLLFIIFFIVQLKQKFAVYFSFAVKGCAKMKLCRKWISLTFCFAMRATRLRRRG